jgi:hypothetical protein
MILTLAVGMAASHAAFALSPPWVIEQNRARATLGADACVTVHDLHPTGPSSFNLDIHVCSDAQARALAAFMSRTDDFGGTTVTIRVFDPFGHIEPQTPVPSNPREATELITAALGSNCYFVQVDGPSLVFQVNIELAKSVVQFPADNIGDFYGNLNEVAADSFAEILDLSAITSIKIGTATSETVISSCSKSSR